MTETKSRQMKPSGVPWLGDIPDGWDIVPSSRVFSEIKQKAGKNNKLPRLAFRYGEIVEKECEGISDTPQQDENATCTVVHSDVIMINGLNLNYDLLSQRVAIVSKQGVITSAYLAVDPVTIVVFPRFAMYLFKGYDARMVFHGFGSGIRKTLKFSDFKDIPFLLPPLPEQRAIADFLDEKCAAIDSIVEEAKSGIEEYAKWKQSVVFQAVTKGLDPHAKMKDSGVRCFGFIPAHWSIRRISTVAKVERGGSPRPIDDYLTTDESGFNWIKIGDTVKGSKYINSVKQKIKQSGLSKTRQVHKGDLVLTNSMSFGEPYILNVDGCIHDGWVCFQEIKSVTTEFLYYVLCSPCSTLQFGEQVSGGVVQNLNVSKVGATLMVVPPPEEQNAIVAYLDEKCAAIDALIEEKKQLIEDLGVYKKSLIYETVTGKRRVG